MKAIFSLLILSIILGLFSASVYMLPFHFFKEAMSKGVKSDYLVVAKPSASLLNANRKRLSEEKDLYEHNDSFRDFHIENRIIPMPHEHPQLSFVPVFFKSRKGLQLGGKYLDDNHITLFSYRVLSGNSFIPNIPQDKIFNLPIFFKALVKKDPFIIWQDLFSKNLNLTKDLSIFDFKKMKKIAYYDLVYSLYILKLRQDFLKNYDYVSLSYDEELNLAKVKLKERTIYLRYKKGVVSRFEVSLKNESILANIVRRTFLKQFKELETDSSYAKGIYLQYKKLSYEQRLSELGMTYLFSAWSHDQKNSDYFKQMIFFLERGKAASVFLRPLYDYAYKEFGSNFSSDMKRIKENQNLKLKRKIKEELHQEIEKEEKEFTKAQDESFRNEDEKIDFYIQKGKENKKNSNESGVLISN